MKKFILILFFMIQGGIFANKKKSEHTPSSSNKNLNKKNQSKNLASLDKSHINSNIILNSENSYSSRKSQDDFSLNKKKSLSLLEVPQKKSKDDFSLNKKNNLLEDLPKQNLESLKKNNLLKSTTDLDEKKENKESFFKKMGSSWKTKTSSQEKTSLSGEKQSKPSQKESQTNGSSHKSKLPSSLGEKTEGGGEETEGGSEETRSSVEKKKTSLAKKIKKGSEAATHILNVFDKSIDTGNKLTDSISKGITVAKEYKDLKKYNISGNQNNFNSSINKNNQDASTSSTEEVQSTNNQDASTSSTEEVQSTNNQDASTPSGEAV